MIWTPHVTVAAVLEQNGRFLLVEEETPGGLRFNQPAGHWEAGETLAAAAVRETLEESAHEFEPDHLIGIYYGDSTHSDITYLRFAFTGRILAHHPERALDDGILRAVWMTPDEIRATQPRHRSPAVLRCVEDYLAGKRYPIDLMVRYDQERSPIPSPPNNQQLARLRS